MTDEVKDAPVAEPNKDATAIKTEIAPEPTGKDVKVSEVLDNTKETGPDMVPVATLIERKREVKDLKGEVKALKAQIAEGPSNLDISSDIKALAEEHDIDPEFLGKLVKLTESQTEAKLEESFAKKLKPMADKERLAEIDKRFNENYEKTISQMPAYAEIADKETIKQLSLDPANSNKTFGQILEGAYGNLVKGKTTLESTQARVEQIDKIDFAKAKDDSEYFKQIMSDPTLKEQYNEGLVARLKL